MGVSAVARFAIKQAAERKGVTLKDLAERGGLSESRVRAAANNRIDNVTLYFLEVIAATLDVPLKEVFEQESLDEVPTLQPGKRGTKSE